MYEVYVDGLLIHDQASPAKEVHLIDPTLKLVDNAAGSFEFTIPPDHEGYDNITLLDSTIAVKREGVTLWTGRALKSTEDFWRRRKYTCEGALAFLNDTVQPDIDYPSTNGTTFLTAVIDIHNKKVAEDRQFKIGTISFEDMADPGEYKTQFETSWETIKENFVEKLSGHLYISYVGGGTEPYINYRNSYFNRSPQEINFGVNLMDFAQDFDLSNVATAIFPRGKLVEE